MLECHLGRFCEQKKSGLTTALDIFTEALPVLRQPILEGDHIRSFGDVHRAALEGLTMFQHENLVS